MQPKEWDELFTSDVSVKKVQHIVMQQVRIHLATLAPGVTLSTTELVEALYPLKVAERSVQGDNSRATIFKIVGKLAREGLEDCCMKSDKPSGTFMGRPRYPWLWFCPAEDKLCPTCGQLLVE